MSLKRFGGIIVFSQLQQHSLGDQPAGTQHTGIVEKPPEVLALDVMADYLTRATATSGVDRPLPVQTSSTSGPSSVGDCTETLVVVGRPRGGQSASTSPPADKFPKQIQDAVSKVLVMFPN